MERLGTRRAYMRILLIEDDQGIAAFVRKGLKEAGYIVEHAEDGKTGLLFEPGNADDLAAKAKTLIDRPSFAEELGRNARAEFEAKYTAKANYKQLMDIYKSVITK